MVLSIKTIKKHATLSLMYLHPRKAQQISSRFLHHIQDLLREKHLPEQNIILKK